MKKLLIVFSFVVSVQCEIECTTNKTNGVLVPTYSLYLIGFLMILMLGIIICLAALLYRNQTKEYKIFSPQNQLQTVTTDQDLDRTLLSQTSREMTILKMDTDPSSVTQFQECRMEDSLDNLSLTTSRNDLKRSTIDKHTGLGKDFKVYRSVKKPLDQQLILREQMKKICEDALAKSHIKGMTASLRDLNKLLQEHNDKEPEKIDESIEKSSSVPDLDVYDNAPSNIPVADLVRETVYDCLPSPQTKNNVIVEDYDTKYLLTISKENISDTDTDSIYINAKYRYTK